MLWANKRVIVLSIDGLPAAYFTAERSREKMPNLLYFAQQGSLFQPVRSVNPTVTFPAHTSMVTGVAPAIHGINGNHPFEPFRDTWAEWNWYAEDIHVKTLWDFAHENKKTVASLYWPVTLGANIRWNIPQYYRYKNREDIKLLRAMSTGGIYQNLEKQLKISLHENSTDSERFAAGAFTVNYYRADLTLIYTTDLDTAHHRYGMFSEKALQTLKTIDTDFGALVKKIDLYNKKNLIFVVVSDHGFREYRGACLPNVWLKNQGYIQPDTASYDFIFRSHAGLAWLLPGKQSKHPPVPVHWSAELTTTCPGITLVHSGTLFEKLKKESEPRALGFLLSQGETIVLQDHSSELVYWAERSFFSHGYPADDPSMATAALVYPAIKKNKTISSITDIFSLVCSGLSMRCHAGEPKSQP